jgi:hypothetical protein
MGVSRNARATTPTACPKPLHPRTRAESRGNDSKATVLTVEVPDAERDILPLAERPVLPADPRAEVLLAIPLRYKQPTTLKPLALGVVGNTVLLQSDDDSFALGVLI